MNHVGVRIWLVAIGCVALACALVVGINDNLPGIALLYGGLVCLTLAAVYRWRRPKSFFLLFALSAVGFFVFAILHNLLYAIGESTTSSWLRAAMQGLHVGAFLIALLLCPVGVLVGLVGWLSSSYRSWRESRSPAAS